MRLEHKKGLRAVGGLFTALSMCSIFAYLLIVAMKDSGDPELTLPITISALPFLFGRYLAARVPDWLSRKYQIIAGAAICFVLETLTLFLAMSMILPSEEMRWLECLMVSGIAGLIAATLAVGLIWSSLRPWRSIPRRIFWTVFEIILLGCGIAFVVITCDDFDKYGIASPLYVLRDMSKDIVRHWPAWLVGAGALGSIVFSDSAWLPRTPYQERSSRKRTMPTSADAREQLYEEESGGKCADAQTKMRRICIAFIASSIPSWALICSALYFSGKIYETLALACVIGTFLIGRYYATALLPDWLGAKDRIFLTAIICFLSVAAAHYILSMHARDLDPLGQAFFFGLIAGVVAIPITWSAIRPWRSVKSRLCWTLFPAILAGSLVAFIFSVCDRFRIYGIHAVPEACKYWRHMFIESSNKWMIISGICAAILTLVFVILSDAYWLTNVSHSDEGVSPETP